MAAKRKVIVSCAITGAIHTPTMSPHLPYRPEDIAAQAIAAAEAGAAILHLHARDPETGKPDQTPEAFARFLPAVRQATDAVINITTGGSPYMRVEERVCPAASFRPELASLNMGSINFGLYPLLGKYKEFKFDWERAHLENTRDLVFRNSFKDIEYILKTCADNGTRFEFECYDIAHLYNLAHFLDRGLVEPPLFVQSVFGILGRHRHPSRGPDAHEADGRPAVRRRLPLVDPRRRAEPDAARGDRRRRGRPMCGSGWRIRSGSAPACSAKSNAEQVTKVRQILEGMSLEVATPDEARAMLALKGGDKVGF